MPWECFLARTVGPTLPWRCALKSFLPYALFVWPLKNVCRTCFLCLLVRCVGSSIVMPLSVVMPGVSTAGSFLFSPACFMRHSITRVSVRGFGTLPLFAYIVLSTVRRLRLAPCGFSSSGPHVKTTFPSACRAALQFNSPFALALACTALAS